MSPRFAPPAARPFQLVQVMAAPEAQGLGGDPRGDRVRGARGGIGHTDHEGECTVPWVRVICLSFPVPGVRLAAAQTLEAGQLGDHLGARPKAAGGTHRHWVGQGAVASLELFRVGGGNVKNCLPGLWESSFALFRFGVMCFALAQEWAWVRSGSHVCACHAGVRRCFLTGILSLLSLFLGRCFM